MDLGCRTKQREDFCLVGKTEPEQGFSLVPYPHSGHFLPLGGVSEGKAGVCWLVFPPSRREFQGLRKYLRDELRIKKLIFS